MVLLQTRCPFTSLVISNIETTFLPWSRFSLGSWSSCLRMYSQSFLVSSVRGSGSLPTTAASAASGCTGLLRAFLGAAAFFGVGIGQLERAGLGCQAKNQPCFSGSRERLGEGGRAKHAPSKVESSAQLRLAARGISSRSCHPWLRTPFRGRLLRRSCVRKIQSVDQEFFERLSVGIRPFLPSTLPRKLAAFFTFDPLVLPDLFFDKVGDPVERIGIHDGRDRNVFFSL